MTRLFVDDSSQPIPPSSAGCSHKSQGLHLRNIPIISSQQDIWNFLSLSWNLRMNSNADGFDQRRLRWFEFPQCAELHRLRNGSVLPVCASLWEIERGRDGVSVKHWFSVCVETVQLLLGCTSSSGGNEMWMTAEQLSINPPLIQDRSYALANTCARTWRWYTSLNFPVQEGNWK